MTLSVKSRSVTVNVPESLSPALVSVSDEVSGPPVITGASPVPVIVIGNRFGIAKRSVIVISGADRVGQDQRFAPVAKKLKASLPELKFQVSVLVVCVPLRIAVGVRQKARRIAFVKLQEHTGPRTVTTTESTAAVTLSVKSRS